MPGDDHAFANNDVPLPGTASSGYLALQWLPVTNSILNYAVSNYVYFGTNSQAVANATTASPEFKTNNAAVPGVTNRFGVTNLNSLVTYYWRVDQLEVDTGATNLVTGNVWAFRPTAPGVSGRGRLWAVGARRTRRRGHGSDQFE